MTDTQKFLLDILAWYHDFCVCNNLRYYITSGTMLGAVRHGGFIPWDDDIDVGMPRKDYESFLTLTQYKQFGRYLVETARMGNIDFIYPFAKLYDTRTTLIENARSPIKRGVYIDIFPLDGIADSIEVAKQNYKSIYNKINLLSALTCTCEKRRKWYKNAAIIAGGFIPKFVVDPHDLLAKIDNLCKAHDFDEYAVVGNLVSTWNYKELMHKEFYGTPCVYNFENITVLGVAQPDNYLSSLYGDYMTLPPIDKRISHHNYLHCDLYQSYLESNVKSQGNHQ